MRVIALIATGFMLCLLLTAAKQDIDFLDQAPFSYGMDIADADRRLADGGEDFTLLYRVGTPSTIQFACTYKESEFYMVRFYQGSCFFIERRSETDSADVERIFRAFSELHGETPDAAQSKDQRLWYAHWMKKDRDIELTASQRDGDTYIITYEEYDPLVLGEALSVMEQEVGDTTYEVDPLTGKPRLPTHEQEDAESGADDSGNADGSGEQSESEQEGEEAEEESDDPPPEDDYDDDDYFDW